MMVKMLTIIIEVAKLLPCLGGTSVSAYFPAGQWFDWSTFKLFSAKGEETKTIDTPIDHLPVR